jgi:hypothetical protein
MVMPNCGTFYYVGVVPPTADARRSGQWTLADLSGAPHSKPKTAFSLTSWWRGSTHYGPHGNLRDDRLVGLEPKLRITDDGLLLEAASRDQAQIRSASVGVDARLLDSMRSGDSFYLARTHTADIGLSLLRGSRLVFAIGAVTVIPLGDNIRVRGGPAHSADIASTDWPRRHTWVDISLLSEARRLTGGQQTAIGDYTVAVIRSFQDGIPGTHECLAITCQEVESEAALRSARILASGNAGLAMERWS